MLPIFEEPSWNHIRVISFTQHLHEFLGICLFQSWKNTRSKFRHNAIKLIAAVQELPNHRTILLQQRFGSITQSVQFPKCSNAEQFRRMRSAGIDQILNSPHPLSQRRLGQYTSEEHTSQPQTPLHP